VVGGDMVSMVGINIYIYIWSVGVVARGRYGQWRYGRYVGSK